MTRSISLALENRHSLLPADVCQILSRMGTGPVSDACPEAVVIGGSLPALKSYDCVAGTALPVDAGPADNLAVWASLKFARPGDVLFVSSSACVSTSVFGDLLVGFSKNCGLAALVTDGCIRDFDGICDTGLPVYAAGTSPKAPAKNGPGKIGHPVRIAGVVIERDMVVVCDRDGIVAFDPKHLHPTLEKLQAVEAKESKAAREIADGRTLPTWIEPVIDTIDFKQ